MAKKSDFEPKNQWIKADHMDEKNIPPKALEDMHKNNCFRWGGSCVLFLYKGDFATTKQFIAVMDDGGFYKVGAKYIVWNRADEGQEALHSQAIWSNKALGNTLTSLMIKGVVTPDPGYQS